MAADYPSGLTSKALMGQAQDNIENAINNAAGITAAATTVTMDSSTAFPTSGYIQIDTETMKYTGKDGSTGLTGLTRGLFGTAAAAHADNVAVKLSNSAGYIDELQEEVVALQTKVGVDTSAVTSTLDFLAKSATARVRLGSNQSITNVTWTKISLDTENWDTGANFDSTTNYRFTAPVAGKYQVNAQINYADNATGSRGVGIYVNGSQVVEHFTFSGSDGSFSDYPNVSDILNLAANDYVELFGHQNSGGALNATGNVHTFMSIALIKL